MALYSAHSWGVTPVKVNKRSPASQYLIVSMLLIFGFSAARADVTGSIDGVVRDRGQAVVIGAKVQITNVQTNVSQEATTGTDGSYHFLALSPGSYKITATASGFRAYNATDITLQVNDQLRIDITLQVGAVAETIDVSATAAHVETESTQLGDVIDSKKMLALPLNGRSYLDLLSLQAGVAPDTAGTLLGNTQSDRPVSGYITNTGNVSVNGQRETANAFLVNGGDVSEGRNLGAGLVPNLDSVEEFRLITNSFDAEYGKFSGAVMNAITKSGTNGFHGDVFEFVRNDKLDAANFFIPQKTELRRNQFGYAIGGPFWKDKVFWFTDYQGTRQVQGAETGGLFLPTDAQRQGNFGPNVLTGAVDVVQQPDTNPCPASVAPCLPWNQVLSNRLGYTVNQGEPYWTNGCNTLADAQAGTCVFPGGVIPKAAWSSAAIGTLSSIPAPNVTNQSFDYENNSGRNRIRDDKIGERVDFHSQRTGDWSWYYHFDDSTVVNALGVSSTPGFPTTTPTRAQAFVMSNTKTLGPTAVNEARATFFRTSTHANTPSGGFASLASLGFNNSQGLGIITDGLPGTKQFMPRLFFNGYSIGPSDLITFQPNNTYMVSDTFSKVVKNHTLKFGGEFRYLQVNERNLADVNGAFNFDGTSTGDGSIPSQSFADYLIGAPSAGNSGYTQAALQLLDSRTRYGGAFVQDTWKATPNLTLNLGLRWEVSMPWYDTQGKIQTWVKGEQSTVFPNSPTGLVYPGDPGIPKTLAPTRYNKFGPRVGIAYSPDFSDGVLHKIFGGPGKTSIRAAYGLYYTSVEDLNLFFEVADAPFGLFWTSPGAVDFAEPFRNRVDGTIGQEGQRFPFTVPTPGNPNNKNINFAVYEPMSFFPGYDIHNELPYAEHFNLSIQRYLSKSTVLTLAYVGTEGHRLIEQEDVNPGNAALCMQLNALGATPTCGPQGEDLTYTLPLGSALGLPCNGNTANCVYGTRNFILKNNFCPESQGLCFGDSNTLTHLAANSAYNSGQVTIERKAGDLTLLASYTLAKTIDNSSAFNDLVNFQNPRLSRGLSSTDVHHNFVASYIWAIPFGRAFGNLPKRLTQGWQLQGITHFSTGFPIQMQQSGEDISLAGSASTDMPDLVGPVVIVNPRKVNQNCATPTGAGCYFLPQAFAHNTTLGTFGTANRRFFHGPGINSFDMGLTKTIPVTEAKSFEIRGEFFNIFNHAQFLNPSGDIDGNFGVVTNARDPRIGQVSAKFIW